MSQALAEKDVLLNRLARLHGAWVGEVRRPDGLVIGHQQLGCAWDAGRAALHLKSIMVSRSGRVLEAEEVVMEYDPASNGLLARFRHYSGQTELARAYANPRGDVVLVSDAQLRLWRLSWPEATGKTEPKTWDYRLEVAQDGRLRTERHTVLRRV